MKFSRNVTVIQGEKSCSNNSEKMKSVDIQKAVKIKHENGDGPTKIYRDLAGVVSLRTIKSWIKMIDNTGAISLSSPPGCSRTARTKANILKVKTRLERKKRISTRKLAAQMKISRRSIQRILKQDLGYFPYKKIKEPRLTELHKTKRVKFANWVLNNYTKDKINWWLFSDEKFFDLDGVYNVQNDRIWAPSRAEADRLGGIHERTKFPGKIMVWLGACSEGFTAPVIFEEGTMNADKYIKDVLPIALRDGTNMLGDRWTYQQDGARPHTHHLSQKWCEDHLPAFIPKDRWPSNSPDLCPLDYSLWNELATTMNWDQITTKSILIKELKQAVKKVSKEKILHSVADFTIRLRQILKTGGDYVR